MKRFAVCTVILSLCVLLVLAGCDTGEETPAPDLTQYTEQNEPLGGMLHVENGALVNEAGRTVVLHGVNLGNWMLMETWMSFLKDPTGDWGYYDTLENWNSRFGAEKTQALVQAYEDNFITASDIAQIEKLGFNCVRVPFWYRNFMTEDGAWLTADPNDNPGFQRLDWLIEQCREHNIYVILDLHGAPGGQSMNHSTGKAGRNALYTDSTAMEAAVRLWTGIAERYRSEPVVAAYDLLNEPQNNDGYEGGNAWPAESKDAVAHTNEAYDTLYKAVRSADENHVISFEGIWSSKVLPDPVKNGYTNMLYQMHLYDTGTLKIYSRVCELKRMRRRWGTAVLVGEYNNGEKEKYAASLYRKNSISTTKWTYKTFNAGSQWGIFNCDVKRMDPQTASYDDLMQFAQTQTATGLFTFNAAEMAAISE